MPRRVRLLIAACTLVWGLGFVAVAAPVGAQDDDTFDENETESTIDSIRYQLWGIAAVSGVLLVVYIWHTDPARRQRVAERRRSDREHADAMALEDEFVLPEAFDEPTLDDPQAFDSR